MMNTAPVSISTGTHRARVLAVRDAIVVENLHLVPPIARRIKRKLPPSYDLAELIAVGNFALVRAATRYRPSEHGGAPFEAYARAAIEGAIKDTFRDNNFAKQTMAELPDNVIEFPAPNRIPALEERIDLARRFAALRNLVTACLPPLQVAVVDEYYSPSMPNLAEVARRIGIPKSRAEKEHAAALRTLREKLKEAA